MKKTTVPKQTTPAFSKEFLTEAGDAIDAIIRALQIARCDIAYHNPVAAGNYLFAADQKLAALREKLLQHKQQSAPAKGTFRTKAAIENTVARAERT